MAGTTYRVLRLETGQEAEVYSVLGEAEALNADTAVKEIVEQTKQGPGVKNYVAVPVRNWSAFSGEFEQPAPRLKLSSVGEAEGAPETTDIPVAEATRQETQELAAKDVADLAAATREETATRLPVG